MNSRIIKSDFSGLDKFVRGLSGKHFVKVGIMGAKGSSPHMLAETIQLKTKTKRMKSKTPTFLTNADVGAQNEFGDPAKKIPMRSFLLMPIHAKSKEIIDDTIKAGAYKAFAGGKIKDVLRYIGQSCEVWIQRAFATRGFGTWKPNAPLTIAIKGSSSPLIDTGQLRRSITSQVV